jgi:signal transduction histidine kinase
MVESPSKTSADGRAVCCFASIGFEGRHRVSLRFRQILRDRAWLLTLVVSGAALATAGTMALSRWALPAERALIPTERWAWTRDSVEIVPVGADSPFVAGDRVVAIEGQPLGELARALFTPWSGGLVRTGTMSVDVIRDGRTLNLQAALGSFPPERLSGAPVGLVIFGTIALALAALLLVRRPHATALRLLFVGVCANTADIVAWETGLQPSDLAYRTPFLYAFGLAAVFNAIFWSCLLHILLIYPVRSRLVVERPRLIALVYAGPIAALVLGAIGAWLASATVLDWLARLAPVIAAVASGMPVLILGAITAGYRRTPGPRRRQVRTLAVTLGVAVTAVLLLTTAPIVITGRPLVARSAVAILALPVVVALAVAVIRDRLFQVDLIATSRSRIVAAREEERRRLRRELHDGLGPSLAAVGLKIDAARAAIVDDPGAAQATLEGARADLRAVVAQVRSLARELRPPAVDSLGLVGALRQAIEAMAEPGGPSVSLADDELPPGLSLPAAVEVAAYRIVVEAVANAIRHSRATRCDARMRIVDDHLEILVRDDGQGMTDLALGVGTRSMYERATEVGGELLIEEARPTGTVVRATLPLGPIRAGATRTEAPLPVSDAGATLPVEP